MNTDFSEVFKNNTLLCIENKEEQISAKIGSDLGNAYLV